MNEVFWLLEVFGFLEKLRVSVIYDIKIRVRVEENYWFRDVFIYMFDVNY